MWGPYIAPPPTGTLYIFHINGHKELRKVLFVHIIYDKNWQQHPLSFHIQLEDILIFSIKGDTTAK